MAVNERYVLSITTQDGVLRPSVSSFYVGPTLAAAWLDAADAAARALTTVGLFIQAYLAMTDCAFVSATVGLEQQDDAPANPADSVLRGNKLSFSVRSGGRGLTFTIPGRKASSYSQGTDSLICALDTPSAMDTFVTRVEDVIQDAFGNPFVVRQVKVVD